MPRRQKEYYSALCLSTLMLFFGMSFCFLIFHYNGHVERKIHPVRSIQTQYTNKELSKYDDCFQYFSSILDSKEEPNSVYKSNDMYDDKGLLKDGIPNLSHDNYSDTYKVPPVVCACTPAKIDELCADIRNASRNQTTVTTEAMQTTSGSVTKTDLLSVNDKAKNIFINCGGTFPWSLEIFLDAYPDSETYNIYSFIMDPSYNVMYKKFSNHTMINAIASTKNSTENVDIMSFGSSFKDTQQVNKMNLAEWIFNNTKERDHVVLKLDSNKENAIAEHLVDSGAIKHIDKYYHVMTSSSNATKTNELLKSKVQLDIGEWDDKRKTYSDITTINMKKIPIPGLIRSDCRDKKDDQKFALILFSKQTTPNVMQVFDLLQTFSPNDRVSITAFLPYSFYKSNSLKIGKLHKLLDLGMYFEDKVISENETDQISDNKLRNQALFVQKIFEKHDHVLQNILIGREFSNDTLNDTTQEFNYNVFNMGVDITHLVTKVTTGDVIKITDTGRESGDYLMIDIDEDNAQYLVLYMVRRFAPWLLKLIDCK